MTFYRKALFNAVALATLGLPALSAQAAEPTLSAATASGAATAATFTGGATINNGSTYITSAASSAGVDLRGTINIPAADVGKSGSLVALVDVAGMGAFQMLSGGFFIPWNGEVSGLAPFAVKTLSAKEPISILDDMIGIQSNLAGLSFQAYFGYYTNNDINTLAYTSTPISVSIAAAPAAGCPTNTTASTGANFEGKPVCVLTGEITSNTHLTANNVYLLNGGVFIGGDNTNSAELTIDAGTKIISPVGLNFLVINRGSKINAYGSEAAPIVFTYDDEANATAATSGRWGGLIINGNAPINGCSAGTTLCEAEGEGSTGKYGGNNPTDSSGVLNYVIVKYAGQNITETNELNGIAFQGVGSGTLVDYVQVHNNSDDGVEFFGGTVNAKHLVLTGNEDDSLDWTFGWSGKVQHVLIKQRAGTGDRGIEADNNGDANDSLPRAKPTLANFTMIGKGSGIGAVLREGTGANMSNFVITNFGSCVDIDGSSTFAAAGSSATALTGTLTMTNSLLNCSPNNFENEAGDPFLVSDWFRGQTGNVEATADVNGILNGSGINSVTPANLADPFFDTVTHIGAIKDAANDWASSWMFHQ